MTKRQYKDKTIIYDCGCELWVRKTSDELDEEGFEFIEIKSYQICGEHSSFATLEEWDVEHPKMLAQARNDAIKIMDYNNLWSSKENRDKILKRSKIKK